jgi:hypothetical protein
LVTASEFECLVRKELVNEPRSSGDHVHVNCLLLAVTPLVLSWPQAVTELALALKTVENRTFPAMVTVPKHVGVRTDSIPVSAAPPSGLSLTVSYHGRRVNLSVPSASTIRDLRVAIISAVPGCGTATTSDVLMALSESEPIVDCFPGNDAKLVDEGISVGTTVFVEYTQHPSTSEVTAFSACDFSTLFASSTPFW